MNVSTHTTHCIVCNQILQQSKFKHRKYCSTKCKHRFHKTNNYKSQQERGQKRKAELVTQAGGCCIKCGYNTNYSALCFHHKHPQLKSFPLDERNLSNRSISSINKEFKKCELLCLNCHAEHHHPNNTLSPLL